MCCLSKAGKTRMQVEKLWLLFATEDTVGSFHSLQWITRSALRNLLLSPSVRLTGCTTLWIGEIQRIINTYFLKLVFLNACCPFYRIIAAVVVGSWTKSTITASDGRGRNHHLFVYFIFHFLPITETVPQLHWAVNNWWLLESQLWNLAPHWLKRHSFSGKDHLWSSS